MDDSQKKSLKTKNFRLGVGLFGFNVKLTEDNEREIILQLGINDLVSCASVNKIPWNRRISEEVKRRKNCVTIYTWISSETSSTIAYRDKGIITQGRMGHSALRTYSGGKDGNGVYVSFYPGDCHTENRSATCRKSVSHFHSFNQETRENAHVIHLYGLDIESLNHKFQSLHDTDMNSLNPWGARYNCSDVVLLLLNEAKLFDRVNYNPFGWGSTILVGYLGGKLVRSVLEGLHLFSKLMIRMKSPAIMSTIASIAKVYNREQATKIILNYFPLTTLSEEIYSSIFYYFSSFFGNQTLMHNKTISSLSYIGLSLGIDGMLDAPGAALSTYFFSNIIMMKKYHYNDLQKTALLNLKRAFGIAMLLPTIRIFTGVFLGVIGLNNINELYISYHNFIRFGGIFNHTEYLLQLYKKSFLEMAVKGLIVVGYPAYLLFGAIFGARYMYDTTTTPSHVYNVAKKAEPDLALLEYKNIVNPKNSQHKALAFFNDNTKKNRTYQYLGLAGLLVAGGLFTRKIMFRSTELNNELSALMGSKNFEPIKSTFGGKHAL